MHNDNITFDGTNHVLCRNHILCNLWTSCPNVERFLDVGFYPLTGHQVLSFEDEKKITHQISTI
jgi:hypothetical protein